ncbi:Trp biosynthesis-associated membrane protein, partial [Candidatus Blastococcus massiliensis]|uniref:Trp biosynthesis-associated membrane protein n=1 Tax=Candidatus Blastococcus massiliensis TaxID=1470358 RepID=UPI001E3D728D
AAPLVPAAGLVLLAAAVALLAVRGTGRVLVGLLAALAGGALGWSGLRVLTGGLDEAGRDLPGLAGATVTGTSAEVGTTWPTLALVAGALAIAAGAFVAIRGRAWPGMGRRYERPGATPVAGVIAPAATAPSAPRTDEDRAAEAWKALDRGEDPTTDRTDV